MQFDLIIIGGGLAGSSLAVALRDSGRRIALIESQPPQRASGWDARVYAISPASRAFLQEIGAWRHLDATRIAPVQAMDIAGDGRGRLRFSAYEAGTEALAWIAESSALGVELWETARRQSNVSLFCPASPAALRVDAEAAHVRLADGRELSGQLVIGADGRDSWVRAAAGLAASDHAYEELGVVANFACELEHADTARQWFARDGVLAWLPLPGQRLSMVWSTATGHARELLGLAPEALALRVAAAGDHALGKLEVITPAAAFPLRLVQVPATTAPRVVLVGDAAHGIHPLSGHGINLGFLDARELARIIGGLPEWQDPGHERLLRRYQRARREEVWLLQQATHGLHELFRGQLPGLDTLRNAGLVAVDRLPFLKSALARYAMG
jgi:ubiquinone biosynthesis UbiH/UbiF/VisC/COQ6 family hydroxylase